jgi:nitrous oxidase accessory protein
MRRRIRAALLLAALLAASVARAYPPLQLFVDLTPTDGVLRPPPGTYAGPVVVRRAMTIEGDGKVTVDGGGEGTVLTIRADGVTLRGLRLTHSGSTYDGVDAGLLVEADRALIEDTVVEGTLFGVHLKQANGNVIRGNRISSGPEDRNLRGDAIRLWYSNDNLVENNEVVHARDMLFTNSADNRIVGNRVTGSRVGMQFVFAPGNLVERNTLDGNETGIIVLYSEGLRVLGNRLWNARHFSGAALALKESSQVVVEGNEIVHCAVGVQANAPTHPENILYLRGNRFAYNDIAMYFYGEKGGHVVEDNVLEKNFVDVAVSHPMASRGNAWRGNYWDTYAGFDLDGDGIGDQPHELYQYADRIWLDRPLTRFFRGSLALELIDFLERLAPFSEPASLLRDPQPRMRPPGGSVAAVLRKAGEGVSP